MDPILFWNGVALEANRVSHTNGKGEQAGPTLSSRALAIVHLAMYDAFVGASQSTLPPYLTPYRAPGRQWMRRWPRQRTPRYPRCTRARRRSSTSSTPGRACRAPNLKKGHRFGLKVARNILDDRKDDPGAGDNGYASSMAFGDHRPDPDNPDQGFHAPFYGARSKLFAVTARHELDPPPEPGDPSVPTPPDPDYVNALQQVRRRGIAPELMGTLPPASPRRNVNQTLIGVYWAYDGVRELGTPPRLYNQIIRRVAREKGNTTEENAQLFALVNVAMADAGILAWDQKYIHDLWRPVVGIREHDTAMGPAGDGDENDNDIDPECQTDWLPLGAPATNFSNLPKTPGPIPTNKNFTPNFPAYPSGHATFGAAAFHIARLFYGADGVDKGGVEAGHRGPDTLFQGLRFVSDELDGVNKDNKVTVRPRHVAPFRVACGR